MAHQSKSAQIRTYVLDQKGNILTSRGVRFHFIDDDMKMPSRATISAVFRDLCRERRVDRWGKGKATKYYVRYNPRLV